MAGLFPRRQIGGCAVNSLAGREQRPIRRIAKLQIEAGHFQSTVGIPGSAGPDVEQPGSRLGEHVAAVDEVQINLLTGAQRLRKNDSDQIVAPPCQLRALERLVVNKFHRNAVGFYFADLKKTG